MARGQTTGSYRVGSCRVLANGRNYRGSKFQSGDFGPNARPIRLPASPPVVARCKFRISCVPPGTSIVKSVDTASSQPGDLVLPLPTAQPYTATSPAPRFSGLPLDLLQELWLAAEAEPCGLTLEEFGIALATIGAKCNHGLSPTELPDSAQKAVFFRSLRLSELALAQACALGREPAWQRFLSLYRASLTRAAVAITGSATLGHDLAESLYAELYGLRQVDGHRQSPLASYSGRGSLLGWLRTTLAQRHVDHHRRTHRETPLDAFDAPSPEPAPSPTPADLAHLTHAVARTFDSSLPKPFPSRLLLPRPPDAAADRPHPPRPRSHHQSPPQALGRRIAQTAPRKPSVRRTQ